jgi:hypothetical protein
MRIRVFFSFLLSFLLLSSATAQKSSNKITITGTVLDESENPVVNAMIMIDGVKSSSMTDSKGSYKIKVKRTAQKIGIISFGSGLIEEAINGRTEINFKFSASTLQQQPDQTVSPGDEGVNTGYNYVKKKDMTSPANKIDGTDRKYASYGSVSEMLTRENSGVKYTGNSYIVRDSKDFFGSVPALLVVDGVYVDNFDGISPSSVESIVVLKGSSAAIYGARGYGGAIVLKTKIQNK